MARRLPRYPIFVPSKGRADHLLTAKMFDRDRVPFAVVVEPSQADAYRRAVGRERVLVLPEDGKGLTYSRNWITDHARTLGVARHWQFDDDISDVYWINRGFRVRCDAGFALAACEDFADRYENVALLSLNSMFFVPASRGVSRIKFPPFYLNHRCYTDILFLNALPNRWRGSYNEDTDMSLQVLADGWCTVLMNAFSMQTPATLARAGGQKDIYVNDGRLRMARCLERVWPKVVTTGRRFQRPQHFVAHEWTRFDTPLRLKPGVDLSKLPPVDRSLRLEAVGEVRSERLRRLMREVNR